MKMLVNKITGEYNKNKYFYLLSFGTWTVLSIFMTFQLYSRYLLSSNNPGFLKALIIEIVFCYLWFFLSPAILKLSFHLSFDRNRWFISSLLHLLSALTGSAITLGIRRFIQINLTENNAEITFYKLFDSVFYALDYGIMSYLLIAFFSYTYKYYSNFKERELKTVQLESELLQAQLMALKVQIQPHFLFNTLNSITALIRKEENEKAIEMVSGLAKFLRFTLDKNNLQLIPLCEEIEMMKTYLGIQQIRFSDRLKIEFNIEPGLEDALIPNLILQPIIENSIKHGISKIASQGEIKIAAKRNNGFLELIVSDNGPGFNSANNVNGIGFSNVQSRLEKIFGKDFLFNKSNNPDRGAKVQINFPFSNE